MSASQFIRHSLSGSPGAWLAGGAVFYALMAYYSLLVINYYPGHEDIGMISQARSFDLGLWFLDGYREWFIAFPEWHVQESYEIRPLTHFYAHLMWVIFGEFWPGYIATSFMVAGLLCFGAIRLAQQLNLGMTAKVTLLLGIFLLNPTIKPATLYNISYLQVILNLFFMMLIIRFALTGRAAALFIVLMLTAMLKESSGPLIIAGAGIYAVAQLPERPARFWFKLAAILLLPLGMYIGLRVGIHYGEYDSAPPFEHLAEINSLAGALRAALLAISTVPSLILSYPEAEQLLDEGNSRSLLMLAITASFNIALLANLGLLTRRLGRNDWRVYALAVVAASTTLLFLIFPVNYRYGDSAYVSLLLLTLYLLQHHRAALCGGTRYISLAVLLIALMGWSYNGLERSQALSKYAHANSRIQNYFNGYRDLVSALKVAQERGIEKLYLVNDFGRMNPMYYADFAGFEGEIRVVSQVRLYRFHIEEPGLDVLLAQPIEDGWRLHVQLPERIHLVFDSARVPALDNGHITRGQDLRYWFDGDPNAEGEVREYQVDILKQDPLHVLYYNPITQLWVLLEGKEGKVSAQTINGLETTYQKDTVELKTSLRILCAFIDGLVIEDAMGRRFIPASQLSESLRPGEVGAYRRQEGAECEVGFAQPLPGTSMTIGLQVRNIKDAEIYYGAAEIHPW